MQFAKTISRVLVINIMLIIIIITFIVFFETCRQLKVIISFKRIQSIHMYLAKTISSVNIINIIHIISALLMFRVYNFPGDLP